MEACDINEMLTMKSIIEVVRENSELIEIRYYISYIMPWFSTNLNSNNLLCIILNT